MGKSKRNARKDAKDIFLEAIKAASPETALSKILRLSKTNLKIKDLNLNLSSFKNIYVIGAGKAVCPLAKGLEKILGNWITSGIVITKYGHSTGLKRIEVIEAGHPIPDENGLDGTKEILKVAQEATKDDLVFCLLTGGASALTPAPPEGITLSEKQKITKLLVNSGATIQEINAVRKHLSLFKGGNLLKAAYPARVITLIISDVVGDDISSIASGPTAHDPSTYSDCIDILKKYNLIKNAPAAVIKRLELGAAGLIEETPKPGNKIFKNSQNTIIANNSSALSAAKSKAKSLGYNAIILSSAITGSTKEAAVFFSSVLKEIRDSGNPINAPACVLMGGETTLEVKGKGLGGRNQEFALWAGLEIGEKKGITILSAGTDGTDGPTDAAGALADSNILKKANAKNLDPRAFLQNNDSYHFFESIGSLFKTGPTGTNVMDIAVGIVE